MRPALRSETGVDEQLVEWQRSRLTLPQIAQEPGLSVDIARSIQSQGPQLSSPRLSAGTRCTRRGGISSRSSRSRRCGERLADARAPLARQPFPHPNVMHPDAPIRHHQHSVFPSHHSKQMSNTPPGAGSPMMMMIGPIGI